MLRGVQVQVLSRTQINLFVIARMAELVDAYVSGAYFERSAGSSPVSGTSFFCPIIFLRIFLLFLIEHRELCN